MRNNGQGLNKTNSLRLFCSSYGPLIPNIKGVINMRNCFSKVLPPSASQRSTRRSLAIANKSVAGEIDFDGTSAKCKGESCKIQTIF